METITSNGTQWKLESVDFVDVDGHRLVDDPEAKIVYDLFDCGQYEQAAALLRSLTRPGQLRSRQPLDWLAIVDAAGDGFDVPIGPLGNALGTTYLTPPVLGDGGTVMTNTVEAPPPKPADFESHLAALKRKRELQLSLARPLTFGDFMDAWLREARLREIENDVICELLRTVRMEAVAGPSEPTDRRPS